MSAPKHTAGPWKVVDNEWEMDIVSPRTNVYEEYTIATVRTGNHEANARLIAAAPELLEALKQTVGQFKFKWPSLPTEYRMWIAELSEQIEAAITKAEGRKP